jgi:hypothetical protein
MLDKLMDGHRKLMQLTAELEALIASPKHADAGELGKLRWAFTREVMEHLYIQERFVFDRLDRSGNLWVRQRAAEFKDSMGPLHADYLAHMRRWQGSVSAAEWQAYVRETRQLLLRFKLRMTDEEKRLYPLIKTEQVIFAKAS